MAKEQLAKINESQVGDQNKDMIYKRRGMCGPENNNTLNCPFQEANGYERYSPMKEMKQRYLNQCEEGVKKETMEENQHQSGNVTFPAHSKQCDRFNCFC